MIKVEERKRKLHEEGKIAILITIMTIRAELEESEMKIINEIKELGLRIRLYKYHKFQLCLIYFEFVSFCVSSFFFYYMKHLYIIMYCVFNNIFIDSFCFFNFSTIHSK